MKLAKLLTVAIAVAGAVTTANAQNGLYKLDVGDFSELKVTDGINVVYNCSTDSAGWAYFECDPKTAQMLMFSNKKNSLNLPTVYVYSMTLQKVENSGDSLVRVARTLPVREFKGSVIGNGSLVVENIKTHNADFAIKTGSGHLVAGGSTRKANLKNVGTGKLEASGLQAEEVKCNILGTGPVDCNASITLTVTGAGSGKVYYGGSPSKITNRSIGVKAISVDYNQVID